MNTKQELLEVLRDYLADLTEAQARMSRVITGTPWVIQLTSGSYLADRGAAFGLGAGSILRSVCYEPARIESAVDHIRENHGNVFPDARAMYRVDALTHEIAETTALIARCQALPT